MPKARITPTRDRFLPPVKVFWLVSASARAANTRFLSGTARGGRSGARPSGVPAGAVPSGAWPSLIVVAAQPLIRQPIMPIVLISTFSRPDRLPSSRSFVSASARDRMILRPSYSKYGYRSSGMAPWSNSLSTTTRASSSPSLVAPKSFGSSHVPSRRFGRERPSQGK